MATKQITFNFENRKITAGEFGASFGHNVLIAERIKENLRITRTMSAEWPAWLLPTRASWQKRHKRISGISPKKALLPTSPTNPNNKRALLPAVAGALFSSCFRRPLFGFLLLYRYSYYKVNIMESRWKVGGKVEVEEIREQYIPLEQLQAHEANYKQHPQKQLAKLIKSLKRFRQVRNIVVKEISAERYIIVAGHGIVEAASQVYRENPVRMEVWRYQKFHYVEEIRVLCRRFYGTTFEITNATGEAIRGDVIRETSWNVYARKEQCEASLAREFNLPLPEGKAYDRQEDILQAWRAAIAKENQ